MCEPTATTATLLSLGFSALTTGVQYMAESQAAKDQNKYNEEMRVQGERNARNAFIFNTNQETQKSLQEEQATSFEIQRVKKERLQKQGEALASSNAAGVSLDALMADYDLQEANYRSALSQEAQFKQQQSRANMQGYQAQYVDRNASYAYNPLSGPSAAGALAGLGAKSVGTYFDFNKVKED